MGAIALDWKAMTGVARREPRAFVDFSSVPTTQWKMHDRLENWARWCKNRYVGGVAPGFELHRSDKWAEREYGGATTVPVEKIDAQYVAKGVAGLPDKHRRAIQWYYLRPRNPTGMARELGLDLKGLADMVIDARTMLMNRGV